MTAHKDHAPDRSAPSQDAFGVSEDMPRILIKQTPFNDLYLILDMLLPSAQIAWFLRDPGSFARNHDESLRAARQLIRHFVAADARERSANTAADNQLSDARKQGNSDGETWNAGNRRHQIRQGRIKSESLLR